MEPASTFGGMLVPIRSAMADKVDVVAMSVGCSVRTMPSADLTGLDCSEWLSEVVDGILGGRPREKNPLIFSLTFSLTRPIVPLGERCIERGELG